MALHFGQNSGSPVAISALSLRVAKPILNTLVSISYLKTLAGRALILDFYSLFYILKAWASPSSCSSPERLRSPSSSSESTSSQELYDWSNFCKLRGASWTSICRGCSDFFSSSYTSSLKPLTLIFSQLSYWEGICDFLAILSCLYAE